METVSPDAAVIGQNLLHEQLSELEAAADVLQGHAHLLIGHALSRAVHLQMGGACARDRGVKVSTAKTPPSHFTRQA